MLASYSCILATMLACAPLPPIGGSASTGAAPERPARVELSGAEAQALKWAVQARREITQMPPGTQREINSLLLAMFEARVGDRAQVRAGIDACQAQFQRMPRTERPAWAMLLAGVELELGESDRVLATIDQLEPRDRGPLRSSMLAAAAQHGQIDMARRLYDAPWPEPGFQAQAACKIVQMLARRRDAVSAKLFIDTQAARDRGLRAYLTTQGYFYIVVGLVQAGRLDDARDSALAIKDDAIRSDSLAHVASAYADASRTQDAVRLVDQIKTADGRADAYAEVAESLARAGRPDEARGILNRAIELVGAPASWKSPPNAAYFIAIAHARLGDVDVAEAIMRKLDDRVLDSGILTALAQGLVQRGDIAGARKMVVRIQNPTTRHLAYETVVRSRIRSSGYAEARRAADTLSTDPRDIERMYGAIATMHARSRDFAAVDALLESVQDPLKRASIYAGALEGTLNDDVLAD